MTHVIVGGVSIGSCVCTLQLSLSAASCFLSHLLHSTHTLTQTLHESLLHPNTNMSSAIPTSSTVVESAVIKAPLGQVWHHIKLESFGQWWSAVKQSDFVKGASPDTDIVKWTFKDGTVLEVKQEEHSVSDVDGHSNIQQMN